jgi:hypothetical protein
MGISVFFLCALAALREVYFFQSSVFKFSLFDRVMGYLLPVIVVKGHRLFYAGHINQPYQI